MKILGIDPGYAIVGHGVVEYSAGKFLYRSHGAITTPAGMDFSDRLEIIFDGICSLISENRPDAMAVEKLFFNTNTTTAIEVAEARGGILLAAKKWKVPIFEYTPLQVKQAVTGYGRAQKSQIIEMTRVLLKLEKTPKPDDAADALAIAICHGQLGNNLLNRYKNMK